MVTSRFRLPLRVRLTTGSSLRLTLAIVAFGTVAYLTSRRAALDAAHERARATAYSLAQRTMVGLRTLLQALDQGARDPAVVQALRTGVASEGARKVLASLPVDSSQTVALGLRALSGRVVLAIRGEIPGGVFDESRRADTMGFGRLFSLEGKVLYEAVAPVFDGGDLIGHVVRVRRLATTATSVRVLTDLLGAEGELLFGNRDGTLWTDVLEPIEGPRSTESARYRRGDRDFVLGSYAIGGTPFMFAVAFPEAVVLAPVRERITTLTLIGLAVLALGVAGSWWSTGRVTRPLTELADAADAITARYSSIQASGASRGDELDRLQHAFATMEASVRGAHAHLEDKIAESRVALEALSAERLRLESALDRLERSEEALRLADQRKDGFLAVLAHELRNPLAPIRNAVQVLKLKAPPNPELRWGHDLIDRQVAQMSRLLEDLMDVSRITHDRLELRRERVDLASVIRCAVETSRPLIDAGGHQLTVAVPADPIHLDADPVRLAQVFSNLLNNSAKYTDQGGHIRLEVSRQGGDVVIAVTDDGIGIAPEALPRVFEQFSRVPAEADRRQRFGGGLGIGLSLVRGLVELHGGTVGAASDGLGRGSRFVVRLPVSVEAVATPGAAPVAPSRERPSSRRLLIADDVADNVESLAALLRMSGYDVVTAGGGDEAVALAEQAAPDVVMLDLGMPGVDGYEACRRIRSTSWGRRMTLIALTGWGQAKDQRQTAAAGFDFHLVKPVDPPALLELLNTTDPRAA